MTLHCCLLRRLQVDRHTHSGRVVSRGVSIPTACLYTHRMSLYPPHSHRIVTRGVAILNHHTRVTILSPTIYESQYSPYCLYSGIHLWATAAIPDTSHLTLHTAAIECEVSTDSSKEPATPQAHPKSVATTKTSYMTSVPDGSHLLSLAITVTCEVFPPLCSVFDRS